MGIDLPVGFRADKFVRGLRNGRTACESLVSLEIQRAVLIGVENSRLCMECQAVTENGFSRERKQLQRRRKRRMNSGWKRESIRHCRILDRLAEEITAADRQTYEHQAKACRLLFHISPRNLEPLFYLAPA